MYTVAVHCYNLFLEPLRASVKEWKTEQEKQRATRKHSSNIEMVLRS